MSVPVLIFLFIGFALMLIGGLMCIVAAFRQGILWGLGYLFLPFVSLIFLIIHWREAKNGFFVSLAGTAIAFLVLLSVPEMRASLIKSASFSKPAIPALPKDPDLTTTIQAQRDHLCDLQEELSRVTTEANRQYQVLADRRKKLNLADQAGVHQFNLDAATYKQETDRMHEVTQKIQSGDAELDRLISDLRCRAGRRACAGTAANSPADSTPNTATTSTASSKKVVIYTTSWCPACKAAKQYLNEKGISYQEIDVEKSPDGRQAFQHLGGTGVPLIVVGDKTMTGFNPSALDAML